MPTAIRLAIAAASITTSARPLLGSSRPAWPAVVSASSLHTVDHTHTPKTSARMSQPINGAARPVPATAAAVPPATPAARDTSSFVRAVDTRGTFGPSADSGCIASGCQPAARRRYLETGWRLLPGLIRRGSPLVTGRRVVSPGSCALVSSAYGPRPARRTFRSGCGTELAGALPAVYRSAPRAGSVTSVVARSDSATPMSCYLLGAGARRRVTSAMLLWTLAAAPARDLRRCGAVPEHLLFGPARTSR